MVKVRNKPQFRLVVLDDTGKIKRILLRNTIPNEKALLSGRGIPLAFGVVQARVSPPSNSAAGSP